MRHIRLAVVNYIVHALNKGTLSFFSLIAAKCRQMVSEYTHRSHHKRYSIALENVRLVIVMEMVYEI